jgi:hypothetical protein
MGFIWLLLLNFTITNISENKKEVQINEKHEPTVYDGNIRL